MTAYRRPNKWARHDRFISLYHEKDLQQPIIWMRANKGHSRFGEDSIVDYTPVEIRGLIQDNFFRTWPMTDFQLAGEIDKQSQVLWLAKSYLSKNGWLDANKRFMYDSGQDRFIHEGIEYEPTGDTSSAQAGDRPTLFMIILKRTNGQETYNS